MNEIKLYHDTRATLKENAAPIKVRYRHFEQTILISTNLKVLTSQWDARAEKVLNHPNKLTLNMLLSQIKLQCEKELIQLRLDGEYEHMTAQDVRYKLESIVIGAPPKPIKKNFFIDFMKKRAEKANKPNTRDLYLQTCKKLEKFRPNVATLDFEDINVDFINDFIKFMDKQGLSKNAQSIHLRNMRAVFNEAIEDEITKSYPFRKIKIKKTPTAKRSLSIEELRKLFTMEPEECLKQALDTFRLIFLLCGINIVDLYNLKKINRGRIEFDREKTGRHYSIKVEPEALEIINKYKGQEHLLSFSEGKSNYVNFYHRVNLSLKKLSDNVIDLGNGRKKIRTPLFPFLSTYWARHSWATIAAELDIPKETIAAALGHGAQTTTDIYIDFDQRKVDDANRRVINYVLYDMR